MISMIVTDLDNTLLRSDSTLADYTVNILKQCQQSGVKVAFATARSMQAVSIFNKLFTPDVFIGYGGSLAMAGNSVIYRCDITAEVSAEIIKECLNTPDILSIYAINEAIALTNDRKYPVQKDGSHYRYTGFLEELGHSYLKISPRATNPASVEKIASRFPMCDLLRYSGEDMYRLANREASKWNAVKAVAKYFDFGIDNITAFGDDYNDLEMLIHCGTGVAVMNAIPEVKAAANYICGTNDENGVAKWMRSLYYNYYLPVS